MNAVSTQVLSFQTAVLDCSCNPIELESKAIASGRQELGHYSEDDFRRPTRLKIRRTFFGDIDKRVATLETFRPSLSQTLGMMISANSSVIC
jgi:hypothetical protein